MKPLGLSANHKSQRKSQRIARGPLGRPRILTFKSAQKSVLR